MVVVKEFGKEVVTVVEPGQMVAVVEEEMPKEVGNVVIEFVLLEEELVVVAAAVVVEEEFEQ